MSHYRVLGVSPGASRAQIRSAYVRAARAAHPDVHRAANAHARRQAAERMCALNDAWRVLGDPARRRIYDAHRIRMAAGATGPVGRSSATTGRGSGATPTTMRPQAEPARPGRIPGRSPRGGRSNPLVLVPAVLFALAMAQLAVALVVGVPLLVGTGFATLGLSVAAFAATPLLMLATTRTGRRPAPG